LTLIILVSKTIILSDEGGDWTKELRQYIDVEAMAEKTHLKQLETRMEVLEFEMTQTH